MVAICKDRNGCNQVVNNPNWIATISPRLVRQRLPWVSCHQIINRNAVAAIWHSTGACVMPAATALRLEMLTGR